MWARLPVPRVESHGGVDYFISLDNDKFINIMDSTRSHNYLEIINPITRKSLGVHNLTDVDKIVRMGESKLFPHFDAKADSVIHNIGVDNIFIGNPHIDSTSVDPDSLPSFPSSSSNPINITKGKEKDITGEFYDVPLYPTTTSVVPDINKTPRPQDFRSLPNFLQENEGSRTFSSLPSAYEWFDDNFT
jgi:hypothetical protein